MFKVLKNWGNYKKEQIIELHDKSVINKAMQLNVIKPIEEPKTKKTKK
jgi:hypothetical protein